MARKKVPLEGVFDTLALRIVIDDNGGKERQAAVQACYRVLPVVQRLWKPIHEEFDDYILKPKASGYQSLHTTVMGKATTLPRSLRYVCILTGFCHPDRDFVVSVAFLGCLSSKGFQAELFPLSVFLVVESR